MVLVLDFPDAVGCFVGEWGGLGEQYLKGLTSLGVLTLSSSAAHAGIHNCIPPSAMVDMQ